MPSSYWEERAKQEKAWQLKQLENDAEFGKLLETYYNQAIDDISDSIEKELNRVGKDQVTQMDVKAYETKAKSIVAEAEKMRANGQKVTYADFSDQVNQRLKVYNATMRINRLEHLKSEVGLDMLRAGIKVDSSLRDKLSGDYQKEVIRQAGIMMDSAQRSPWTGKDAAKILMAQTNGATFSQRLWADQDALKAKLDQVLSVGMIQGQNPRKMATRLREQVKTAVGNQRYVTERLARTESARIQTNVQLESIKKHGYNYVQWIAEPKACPACRAIASRDSGFGEGVYKVAKVPKIPDDTHPNCRCSISETWVDGKQNLKFSYDELGALKRYVSSDSYKLNLSLRNGKVSRDQKEIIKYLDSALAKTPTYQDEQPLFRSFIFNGDRLMTYDFAKEIIDKGYYLDKAYISTSKNVYDPDNEDLRIIIVKSSKGRDLDIININSAEKEVLFARGTAFKVIGYGMLKNRTPYIKVVEDE